MELLLGECSECGVPKTASISLVSRCCECGLDCREITYEIPDEFLEEIIREIFTVIDNHKLRPKAGYGDIPSCEELLLKLQS